MLAVVRRTAGGAVDADAPLMEAGVDSLSAVELRNQLQAAAGGGASLPSTLVFDHPTARQLATLLGTSDAVSAEASATAQCALLGAPEASMSGLGVLLPASAEGGVWRVAACATDTIEQVPACRWAALAGAGAHGATRHGGFVDGADLVDADRFGLSPAETAAMDPQQRLVLERGYEALLGVHQQRFCI